MPNSGVCCANLKDNKALMKMGLGLVLVGHVNFLLGALVHGAVLRHINVHSQARTMVYAISNVIAIVAGLVQWVLLVLSFLAGLLAVASTVALLVSMVKAISNRGWGLLTHCTFSEPGVGTSSVTYECPFDPTRIYVRIQRPVDYPPLPKAPDPESEAEADPEEPAEQDELLEEVAVEQSAWL
ncbi:hypothetical protein F7725_007824 [Dissostichus mawsoni]|uniref:Transmembrane protein 54 n=1 Tax=Dissostichus mawsoni TaxID=36200 RepID=A0A7J5Y6I8_DISMA|nr:hypothetical protein F7725_007824 [Dissostichus mawsoni]